MKDFIGSIFSNWDLLFDSFINFVKHETKITLCSTCNWITINKFQNLSGTIISGIKNELEQILVNTG